MLKREHRSPTVASDSDGYKSEDALQKPRRKRRKAEKDSPFSFEPILATLDSQSDADQSYESVVEKLAEGYTESRDRLLKLSVEFDKHGQILRPLSRHEVLSTISMHQVPCYAPQISTQAIVIRKLKLSQQRPRVNAFHKPTLPVSDPFSSQLPKNPVQCNAEVIAALANIQTTPYENSFMSRLQGAIPPEPPTLHAVDWETVSPWMNLMNDIRAHHGLAHPERDQEEEIRAPITYVGLQPEHLLQVHDILARSFWAGINVTDSLEYSPERCTVVALYNRLVVGVAIISSPRETYITYLAVRAGWDNSQIATSMLFYLITLNPHDDITLHVSANNPAMLLYNRFGFKAEEFVSGFYEDYLDPSSRASKNAFRLRLRR